MIHVGFPAAAESDERGGKLYKSMLSANYQRQIMFILHIIAYIRIMIINKIIVHRKNSVGISVVRAMFIVHILYVTHLFFRPEFTFVCTICLE